MDFLHETLAALCLRLRQNCNLNQLNWIWADSLLRLLLPRPALQQQQEQQQPHPVSGASVFLSFLGLSQDISDLGGALPPATRKSKSLGYALGALVGRTYTSLPVCSYPKI